MRRYLRVLWAYFRLGVLGELEYRVNFWVQLLESALGLSVALGGLAVVFAYTDSLAGWLPEHLLALVGIHLTVGGLINLIISPSLGRFMQDVRRGTLDFTLVKPVDAQFVVSIQQVQVWKLVDVALGIGVWLLALLRLGARVGLSQALAFGLAFVAGVMIVYSFWVILATIAFWAVRVENVFEIFNALFTAGRWPVNLYPQWLRIVLTFVVPVAFAVTVPAQGLIGRLTTGALLEALALALGLFVGARAFWKFGLRRYSGASA